jgi:hypothetical protein
MREETLGLPRFQELASRAPVDLIQLGLHFGVTNAQICTIRQEELLEPLPPGVNEETIDQFPTPGKVIGKISHGDKKRMLERLYPEYVYLCSFAHGSGQANLLKIFFNERSPHTPAMTSAERSNRFERDVIGEACGTSLFSIAQGVAELTRLYPQDMDLPAIATEAWEQFGERSLWTKAIWEIRTCKLLGAIA